MPRATAILQLALTGSLLLSCAAHDAVPPSEETDGFGVPAAVEISGYAGDAMEPFLSRDGRLLFFNTRNGPHDQTDLQVARAESDLRFVYLGPLAGANSASLDGVASLDRAGHFFFISNRSYGATGTTLWTGELVNGRVTNARPLATDFTPKKLLRLNIDMEISADGQTLYVAENRWDLLRSRPATSDLAMATKVGERFVRDPDSDRLLKAVNTPALEYAPATSADQLTLYFTRMDWTKVNSAPDQAFAILMSRRASTNSAWQTPVRINTTAGHVEAPTVSPDGCRLYYHANTEAGFRLFTVKRRDCR